MDTCVQFCILLTLLSPKLASTCLDGNCRNLAFPSFFFFANKRLVKHNIRTVMVLDMDVCELLCYHDPNCVSVNFKSTSNSDGRYSCELNNATHQGRDGQFKDEQGYFYHAADSACDKATHCENGGTCQSGFTEKRYRCICPLGFTGEICEKDIDECASDKHNCSDDAACNNTQESFNCTYKPGFTGNGYKCEDIDECASETHNCSDQAVCNNTKGSFNCTCKPGFSGNGYKCEDIDECNQRSHDCNSDASCTNTVGSYNCPCNPGYEGDGKTSCKQIPECYEYQKLKSADRKITHTKGGVKCDNMMGAFIPGWYRFEGAAGTRMATSCQPQDRCDTRATSWLDGEHPTVTEGQVSRRVCFNYNNCCWKSTDTKVRNCGSYYVYYFKWVPQCNARYCGIDD